MAIHRIVQNFAVGRSFQIETETLIRGTTPKEVDEIVATANIDLPITGTLTAAALRSIYAISDQDVTFSTNGVKAFSILTLTGNAIDAESVTIKNLVYTFQDTLTDLGGHVHIGVDADETLANLVAAITLGPGAGTKYSASTLVHPFVGAIEFDGDTIVVFAKNIGVAGNSFGATDNLVNGSWSNNPMSGGVDVGDSHTLKANQPLIWTRTENYFPTPISVDVVNWNVTNQSGFSARVRIETMET